MTKLKKISPSGKLGLNKKQKTNASGELFSTPKIHEKTETVKSFSKKRRYSPVCYLCGASQKVITFHAAGGILGVCDSCNGGIL